MLLGKSRSGERYKSKASDQTHSEWERMISVTAKVPGSAVGVVIELFRKTGCLLKGIGVDLDFRKWPCFL